MSDRIVSIYNPRRWKISSTRIANTSGTNSRQIESTSIGSSCWMRSWQKLSWAG